MPEAEAPRDEGPEAATRARRWPRRAAIGCGALAALALVGRAALPFAIERGAAWAAPRYLGLPLRIENVDLGLFAGVVDVEGLALGSRPVPQAVGEAAAAGAATAAPPPPLLRWERLHADLAWRPLFDRTLALEQIALEGPAVRLERNADGAIDPLAHAAPTLPPDEPAAPPPADAEPAAADAAPEPADEPWAISVGRLALRRPDVLIADEASGVRLVEVGFDELGLDAIRIHGAEIGLGAVSLAGPVVRMRRDFLLGQRRAEPPAPAATATAAAPPARAGAGPDARIERIGIERARFTWITDAGPLDVSIALSAEGVTAREGETFPLRLELGIEDGSVLLDGRLGASPPSYVGKLRWEGLPFPPLTLAARPELAGWVRSCRASGALDVTAQLAGAEPGVRVSGALRVDDLDLGDPERKQVGVAWKALEIELREARIPLAAEGAPPAPIRVELARVALREPELLYVAPAPALAHLLGGEPAGEPVPAAGGEAGAAPAEAREEAAAPAAAVAPAAPAAAEAGAPLEFVLDRFELAGLAARYEDLARAKPLRTAIEDLAIELDGASVRSGAGGPEVAIATVAVRAAELAAEDEGVSPPYRGRVRDLSLLAHAARLP